MDVNPKSEPQGNSSAFNSSASLRNGVKTPLQDTEKQDSLFGFVWFLLKLILVVLIVRSFVFAPFSIPSESMLPRLWQGDYVIATKWSYGYSRFSLPFNVPFIPGRIFASTPERGDVVIFKHPIDQQDYVKRVIGLPGDTVSMIGGQIVLNGEVIPKEEIADFVQPVDQWMLDNQQQLNMQGFNSDSACQHSSFENTDKDGVQQCEYPRFRETLPGGAHGEAHGGAQYDVLDMRLSMGDSVPIATVPEGHIFVMGDNRDYSQDSRFPAMAGGAVGMVPQDNLVGRARFIFWSTDGSAQWIKPWTWFSATRWNRIGNAL